MIYVERDNDAGWKKPRMLAIWHAGNPNGLFPEAERSIMDPPIRIIGGEISGLTSWLREAGADRAILFPEPTKWEFEGREQNMGEIEEWNPANCPKVPIMSEFKGGNLLPTLWQLQGVNGESNDYWVSGRAFLPLRINPAWIGIDSEVLGGNWNPTMGQSEVPIVWTFEGGNREPTTKQLNACIWKLIFEGHKVSIRCKSEYSPDLVGFIIDLDSLSPESNLVCETCGGQFGSPWHPDLTVGSDPNDGTSPTGNGPVKDIEEGGNCGCGQSPHFILHSPMGGGSAKVVHMDCLDPTIRDALKNGKFDGLPKDSYFAIVEKGKDHDDPRSEILGGLLQLSEERFRNTPAQQYKVTSVRVFNGGNRHPTMGEFMVPTKHPSTLESPGDDYPVRWYSCPFDRPRLAEFKGSQSRAWSFGEGTSTMHNQASRGASPSSESDYMLGNL